MRMHLAEQEPQANSDSIPITLEKKKKGEKKRKKKSNNWFLDKETRKILTTDLPGQAEGSC